MAVNRPEVNPHRVGRNSKMLRDPKGVEAPSNQIKDFSLPITAAMRAASTLATNAARGHLLSTPCTATPTTPDAIAHVVHRFVTDLSPRNCAAESVTGGTSLRAMYAEPHLFSRAIVLTLAAFFRPEVLPDNAQQAA